MTEPTNTTPAPFDPFAEFERMTSAEGGGGGTIALCEISYGYKSYAAGQAQGDTFFSFVPSVNDTNGQAAVAKASAEAYNTLHQCPKPVRLGVQIKAMRNGALTRGQPVNWSVDARYFNTDGWTEACKEVVIPSLKANGILVFPWKGWARLGFKPDPYKTAQGDAGKTDHDLQGNPRFPLVAYVVEVFPDEATAHASAAADAPSPVLPSDGNAPAWSPVGKGGWTVANLKEMSDTFKRMLSEGQTFAKIVSDNDIAPADLLVALGEHRTSEPPIMVAKKYGVDVAEVAKVREQASVIPF